MTDREPTPADAALVAIDIAKLRNDVLIQVPGSVRRKRLTVLNTKAEHDRFVELLGGLGRSVIAGFEATSNYHRPLVYVLVLERLQPPRIRHVETAELGLPLVERPLDTPCLRHTSAVAVPASCSRKMPMICSSLNRLRFIMRLLSGDGLYSILEEFSGLRSAAAVAESAVEFGGSPTDPGARTRRGRCGCRIGDQACGTNHDGRAPRFPTGRIEP